MIYICSWCIVEYDRQERKDIAYKMSILTDWKYFYGRVDTSGMIVSHGMCREHQKEYEKCLGGK